MERLRQAANDSDGWSTGRMDVMDEAADLIERLRARLALAEAVCEALDNTTLTRGVGQMFWPGLPEALDAWRKAADR